MSLSNGTSIYEALGRRAPHPFPARMAPGIVLDLLAKAPARLRVLDPMMGSGTVIALAQAKGHAAIGIDIDPLSILIGRVWTSVVEIENVRLAAIAVLDRARYISKSLLTQYAYPDAADTETKSFVRYWFDAYARRQLTALAKAIADLPDGTGKDVLWCAFSRLIITKQAGASLAMDLAHSRPHKVYSFAPVKPFNKFLWTVDRVLESCVSKMASGFGPAPNIQRADARNIPLESGSIDLVLTSPPYLNAIDYLRCSKFALVWMGHNVSELRKIRNESVGSEAGNRNSALDAKIIDGILLDLRLESALVGSHLARLSRYISDMVLSVQEVARVLAPGGQAVYVIGENTIRGTYIPNSIIIRAAAKLAGLELLETHSRNLPANRRYLPPPSRKGVASLDARLRREVVMTYVKLAD